MQMRLPWKVRVRGLLRECREANRVGGAGLIIRRFGRRTLVGFFIFYLFRDVTLYVLLPFLVARHLF